MIEAEYLTIQLAEECAKTAALLTSCKAFVSAANDALAHWDGDRDAKVGKLLAAMSGHLTGYSASLTAAHAAIALAEPPASA